MRRRHKNRADDFRRRLILIARIFVGQSHPEHRPHGLREWRRLELFGEAPTTLFHLACFSMRVMRLGTECPPRLLLILRSSSMACW